MTTTTITGDDADDVIVVTEGAQAFAAPTTSRAAALTDQKKVKLVVPVVESSSSSSLKSAIAGGSKSLSTGGGGKSKSKHSLLKVKSQRSRLSRGLDDSFASAERLSRLFRSDGNLLRQLDNDASVRSLSSQMSPTVVGRAHASLSSPFCRICFMGAEEAPLLRVCRCRGTVGMVHHHCLVLWNLQRQSYTCEICNHSYRLHVNGLRWCWNWVYPVPRSHVATQLLLFCMSWIVMVFSIASLVFIAFNLKSLFPDDVTAGVFIIMNSFTLLCSVGILLTQSLYPIRNMCHRFCMANLDVEVLPYQESNERLAREALAVENPPPQTAVVVTTETEVQTEETETGNANATHGITDINTNTNNNSTPTTSK